MTPKVSIIVPAFNAEAHITECVDHLLAINYPDFEIIVVDDGSTDQTADLLAAYSDKVQVIRQSNSGVSRARNVGLKAAKGEFILFCDADDYYIPDSIALLVGFVSDQTDIVSARAYTDESLTPCARPTIVENLSGEQMALLSLYQKPNHDPSCWAKLFRKSLFDDSTLFRPDIRYEDLELSLRLFYRARRVVCIDSRVYFYRQHPRSFLHTWSSGRLDSLTVTDTLVKQATAIGPEMERAARSRRYSAAWNLLVPAWRHGEREAVDRCRKIIREERWNALRDSNVRFKNKIASILAIFI